MIAAQSPIAQVSVPKANANILIIEDDKDTAEALLLYLANEGYGVRMVSSRDEALKVLDSYIYDCIVMDNFMPGMTPEKFMKEALRRRPATKFILMTATNCVAQEAERLGVNRWIGKPFLPEDLVRMIQGLHSKQQLDRLDAVELRERIVTYLCCVPDTPSPGVYFGTLKNLLAQKKDDYSEVVPDDRLLLETMQWMLEGGEIKIVQNDRELGPHETKSVLTGAFQLVPTAAAHWYYRSRKR